MIESVKGSATRRFIETGKSPWRILFRFENGNVHEVHIHDPH